MVSFLREVTVGKLSPLIDYIVSLIACCVSLIVTGLPNPMNYSAGKEASWLFRGRCQCALLSSRYIYYKPSEPWRTFRYKVILYAIG